MFTQRKMLAMMFLLFIIVVSLMFSGLYSPIMEGMTDGDSSTGSTSDDMTEEEMFQQLSGGEDTITLSVFKTILQQHPELKTLLTTKLSEAGALSLPSSNETEPGTETETETGTGTEMGTKTETDTETEMGTKTETGTETETATEIGTEPFVTRLTPSELTSTPSKLTPLKKQVVQSNPNNVGVYNRVFEFSNPQPFQLKGP